MPEVPIPFFFVLREHSWGSMYPGGPQSAMAALSKTCLFLMTPTCSKRQLNILGTYLVTLFALWSSSWKPSWNWAAGVNPLYPSLSDCQLVVMGIKMVLIFPNDISSQYTDNSCRMPPVFCDSLCSSDRIVVLLNDPGGGECSLILLFYFQNLVIVCTDG